MILNPNIVCLLSAVNWWKCAKKWGPAKWPSTFGVDPCNPLRVCAPRLAAGSCTQTLWTRWVQDLQWNDACCNISAVHIALRSTEDLEKADVKCTSCSRRAEREDQALATGVCRVLQHELGKVCIEITVNSWHRHARPCLCTLHET